MDKIVIHKMYNVAFCARLIVNTPISNSFEKKGLLHM